MHALLALWHDYPGSTPEPLSPAALHNLEVFLFWFGLFMLLNLLIALSANK